MNTLCETNSTCDYREHKKNSTHGEFTRYYICTYIYACIPYTINTRLEIRK